MDKKTWFQLRGLWTAVEERKATRKELNREIGELEKRIDLFIRTGDDPGDDGQETIHFSDANGVPLPPEVPE